MKIFRYNISLHHALPKEPTPYRKRIHISASVNQSMLLYFKYLQGIFNPTLLCSSLSLLFELPKEFTPYRNWIYMSTPLSTLLKITLVFRKRDIILAITIISLKTPQENFVIYSRNGSPNSANIIPIFANLCLLLVHRKRNLTSARTAHSSMTQMNSNELSTTLFLLWKFFLGTFKEGSEIKPSHSHEKQLPTGYSYVFKKQEPVMQTTKLL